MAKRTIRTTPHTDADPGMRAFMGGIEEFGASIAPGLGIWIGECVRRALEERGLKYQYWRWPHDTGHMWDALPPHPSCLERGLTLAGLKLWCA